ncbi:hypothetical protein GOBAR_DD15515 [Gossypium barbadense]|nr:hypothetical protein GOBAR_DD15515 [Gossypium barbadense]
METSLTTRRHQSEARSVSPHLLRSRSGTSALNRAPPVMNSTQSSAHRSKSTTRSSRTLRNGENINPTTTNVQKKPNHQEGRDGVVRFMQQRGSGGAIKGSKSVTSSPSAWALSPGRSSPLMVGMEPQGSCGSTTEVKAKYSKSWRFVNARAEVATNADKLFGVWLRILKIRNSTLEKRIQLEKLIHEIKLHQIVGPQLCVLNEWAKLEAKNYEAVSRVIRKLSAVLVRVPLNQDAKVDVESLYEAVSAAIAAMDGIEATIINIFSQPVEKMLYMVTELISMVEQEKQCLEEMEKVITLVPPKNLLVSEQSLRVHLIQAAKESRKGQTPH